MASLKTCDDASHFCLLEEQNLILRRQNRLLKGLGAVLALLGTVVTLAGAVQRPGTVKATEFILVDSKGVTRGQWHCRVPTRDEIARASNGTLPAAAQAKVSDLPAPKADQEGIAELQMFAEDGTQVITDLNSYSWVNSAGTMAYSGSVSFQSDKNGASFASSGWGLSEKGGRYYMHANVTSGILKPNITINDSNQNKYIFEAVKW